MLGCTRRFVKEGLLREDLLHRLQVVALDVPGLAKRRDDIPLLVGFIFPQLLNRLNGPTQNRA